MTGLPFPTAPGYLGGVFGALQTLPELKSKCRDCLVCVILGDNALFLSLSRVTGIPECQASVAGKSCAGRSCAWKFPHPLLSLLQSSGVLKCGEIPVGGNVKCVFVWSWDRRVAVWERSFGSGVVFSLREICAVARGRFQERSCCCCHQGESHW